MLFYGINLCIVHHRGTSGTIHCFQVFTVACAYSRIARKRLSFFTMLRLVQPSQG